MSVILCRGLFSQVLHAVVGCEK